MATLDANQTAAHDTITAEEFSLMTTFVIWAVVAASIVLVLTAGPVLVVRDTYQRWKFGDNYYLNGPGASKRQKKQFARNMMTDDVLP